MNLLVIIPARQASVRFPGKPLVALAAADGTARPLVEWCWRAACSAVDGAGQVIVATDDTGIAAAVDEFGGRAVMTSPDLRNGTERCAAVLDMLDEEPDLIINLQGDSPLVPPAMIHALAARFADPQVQVATPFIACDAALQRRILADAQDGVVGGTCVVSDGAGRALYFSKYPIPYGAGGGSIGSPLSLKLHIGLYAYRPAALRAYCQLPPSAAEQAEGLEQLRFLDAGVPIHMVEAAMPDGGIWEVNNPEDVPVVERLLPAGHDI